MNERTDLLRRPVSISRNTSETKIELTFHIDGSGSSQISTGIGFFDHMLTSFTKHGNFDLNLQVTGDLNVDCHHTVEDSAIVLGAAIRESVGQRTGLVRYGFQTLPMDDALVMCAIDLSSRPYFVMDAEFSMEKIGDFETQTVREFFYSLAYSAAMNLHLRKLSGDNDHHVIEAMFKAFGRSLRMAARVDTEISGVMSTKGIL